METRGELGEWSLQLQGHASIFHVEGRRRPSTSQQDEAALVQAARKELQRHKTQRRLSRCAAGRGECLCSGQAAQRNQGSI